MFGAGATGARIARQLRSSGRVGCVEVRDQRDDAARTLATTLGAGATVGQGRHIDPSVDAVVIATPSGTQATLARRAVHQSVAVVTTSNQTEEVRRLLDLDQEARHHKVAVVVGAGFMPGFTDLLARHGAAQLDQVDEIHVAKVGTGGPACARQHHRALSSPGLDWRTGAGRDGTGVRVASSPTFRIRSVAAIATGPRSPTPCCSCPSSRACNG